MHDADERGDGAGADDELAARARPRTESAERQKAAEKRTNRHLVDTQVQHVKRQQQLATAGHGRDRREKQRPMLRQEHERSRSADAHEQPRKIHPQ